MTARIKRDDTVMVMAGKDRGKRGKVQRVLPRTQQVLVEGVNIVKRHRRAAATGARQAGIISKEMPLNASKVMPVCPNCNKPARVGITVLADGTKARVCKLCQAMMN